MGRHAQDGTNPDSKTVEQIEKEAAHDQRVATIYSRTPLTAGVRRQIAAARTSSLVVPR